MVFCCILHSCVGKFVFSSSIYAVLSQNRFLRLARFCVEKNLAKNSARGEKWKSSGMCVRHTFSRSEKGMSLRFPHSSPDLLAEKIYHIRFWRCYPIRKMFVQSGAPQIFLLNRMLESLPMQMQLERSLFRFSYISYTSHFVFYVATFNIM